MTANSSGQQAFSSAGPATSSCHPAGLTEVSNLTKAVPPAAPTASSIKELPFRCVPPTYTMADILDTAESVYTYYGIPDSAHDNDTDEHNNYNDDVGIDDDISVDEKQCFQASAIYLIRPGHASMVDLMRAERPNFKHAKQMMLRRPPDRPRSSPLQPPASSNKRPFSRVYRDCSESGSGSDTSARPSTPTLDEDGASTQSDASPATPDSPKTSFGDDLDRPTLMRTLTDAPMTISKPFLDDGGKHGSTSSNTRARKPSRFRRLTQRSLSISVPPAYDSSIEPIPSIPAMYTHTAAAHSVCNLDLTSTTTPKQAVAVRSAAERTPVLTLPPSPKAMATPPPPASPEPSTLVKDRLQSRKTLFSIGRSRMLGLGRRAEFV